MFAVLAIRGANPLSHHPRDLGYNVLIRRHCGSARNHLNARGFGESTVSLIVSEKSPGRVPIPAVVRVQAEMSAILARRKTQSPSHPFHPMDHQEMRSGSPCFARHLDRKSTRLNSSHL